MVWKFGLGWVGCKFPCESGWILCRISICICFSKQMIAMNCNIFSGAVTLLLPSILASALNFDLNISVTDGVFASYSRLHVSFVRGY